VNLCHFLQQNLINLVLGISLCYLYLQIALVHSQAQQVVSISQNQQMCKIINKYKVYVQPLHICIYK
jgi:hypothetical protein